MYSPLILLSGMCGFSFASSIPCVVYCEKKMGRITKILVLFMVKIHYLVVIVNKGDTFVVGYIFVISLCLERIDLPWSDKKARYVFFCQFRYKPSSLGLLTPEMLKGYYGSCCLNVRIERHNIMV